MHIVLYIYMHVYIVLLSFRQDNTTAIYMASQNGHHSIVLALTVAGADVNIATFVSDVF